jgi:hypothetical protein
MAAKPYASQSWTDNEPLLLEKLNAMTNNDQYLFENMPTMYYNAHGVKKTAGTKIMSAAMSVGATSSSTFNSGTFYFGNFFSSGCRPMVIASIISTPQYRLHVAVRGIDTFWPDQRGFRATVSANELNAKANKIKATVWVPFIAIGW